MSAFFPYPTVSSFFEENGDFPENLVEEHAFIPGDGEIEYTDVCQHPGCGAHLSEHEEAEPCCFPGASTRGAHHAPDCQEA